MIERLDAMRGLTQALAAQGDELASRRVGLEALERRLARLSALEEKVEGGLERVQDAGATLRAFRQGVEELRASLAAERQRVDQLDRRGQEIGALLARTDELTRALDTLETRSTAVLADQRRLVEVEARLKELPLILEDLRLSFGTCGSMKPHLIGSRARPRDSTRCRRT